MSPLAPFGRRTGAGAAARARLAAMVAAALLAGCAPPALHRPDGPSEAAAWAPVQQGVELARDARYAIVVAQPGETLAALAARWRADASRRDELARFNGLEEVRAGDVVAIPLGERNTGGIRPGAAQTVTILCYHRFGAQANALTVTPAAFEAQMAWLAGNGYTVISFERLRAFLEGRQSLPGKSVLITIDDGYRSTYEIAFPILAKHRFPATLFLYTDFVGAPDALTWGQMREMGASGLVAVQPHSKTHSNLAVRQTDESEARYRERVRREIEGPIESIRRELGARTLVYAFPYGDVNDVAAGELRARGVAMGVTVTPGGNAFFAPPRMLRRTMVFGGDDLDTFRGKLVTSIPFGKP